MGVRRTNTSFLHEEQYCALSEAWALSGAADELEEAISTRNGAREMGRMPALDACFLFMHLHAAANWNLDKKAVSGSGFGFCTALDQSTASITTSKPAKQEPRMASAVYFETKEALADLHIEWAKAELAKAKAAWTAADKELDVWMAEKKRLSDEREAERAQPIKKPVPLHKKRAFAELEIDEKFAKMDAEIARLKAASQTNAQPTIRAFFDTALSPEASTAAQSPEAGEAKRPGKAQASGPGPCPKCGADTYLVPLHKCKVGQFYGCTKYKDGCKGLRSL